MKKVFLILLLWSTVTFAEDKVIIDEEAYPLHEGVKIEVNGQLHTFEEPPYIVKGRTIVPIQFLMNELGYEAYWDGATKTVTYTRGEKEMVIQINNPEIIIDGVVYMSDMRPLIVNDRTYVPLAIISRGTGADVYWDASTSTVSIHEKIEKLNVFYGRSSFSNYQAYGPSPDQMSFAWSRISLENGQVQLNTSSKDGNLMYIPTGHEMVMDSPENYLNIYSDDYYESIFTQQDALISDIKRLLVLPNDGQPEFDGVVIDFENMSYLYNDEFIDFMTSLRSELNGTKGLYVALQPRAYDYKAIIEQVDGMILMLHDYETKDNQIISLSDGYVNQPLTPIQSVESDLKTIIEDMTVHEKSRVLLQLNLSVVQWQGENRFQMSRYTPNYDKLIERFKQLEPENFKYHEVHKNPYVTYIDEENRFNTIWYENVTSILEKIGLVKEYNLGGVSLWHLGNLPEEQLEEYEMNIWDEILKNLLPR